MRPQDDEQGSVAEKAKRALNSLVPVLSEEGELASSEGVPARTHLQGILNALLEVTAFIACNLISAERDPNIEAVRARISRAHLALEHALEGIMRGELVEAGDGGRLPWRGPQKGHA